MSCRVTVSKTLFIARAAPVLVLPIEKIVMKLNPITMVFMAPSKIRNPLFDC